MQKNSNPKFKLEIVSPNRIFYSDIAEMVIVNASDGSIGVMKGRLPMVTFIVPGTIKIKRHNEWLIAAIGEGYMAVTGDNTYIVTDFAEWPNEIDEARALAAKERAEERLRKKLSREEYIRSKAAMSRALARLAVKKVK